MSAVRPDVDSLEIRAPGLLVRPWRAADAARVYEACQDPDIQRWTGIPRPYLPEHAEGFVTATTRQAWANGTSAPLGVFDAATGDLLGSNGLNLLDRYRGEGEIGYWVAPWARRRGVATRATHAVAQWCLQNVGLLRVQWRAEVGNHASRLVAERLGFRIEGVLRHGIWRVGGGRADCWIGSLLPGQLRAPDVRTNPVLGRRAATYGAAQPRLEARTHSGEAVGLRAPTRRDLEAIVAACRDPDSVRWTSVPDPYEPADAEYFVAEHAPRRWTRGEGGVFAVVDGADAYAGSIELRLSEAQPDVAEVGFLIAPWSRGRGFGSAAVRAACGWAFEALGLNRIEWRAYVGNEASRRVAQRAGFTMEGTARDGTVQRGRYRDAWTGSVLRSDWSAAGTGANPDAKGGDGGTS